MTSDQQRAVVRVVNAIEDVADRKFDAEGYHVLVNSLDEHHRRRAELIEALTALLEAK